MKLFGTDGIRGKVGEFPITPSDMRKLGHAIAKSLFKDNIGNIYTSHDGRESAENITFALLDGLCEQGSDDSTNHNIYDLGLSSTPALSYLLSTTDSRFPCLGIQITASHNPYQDNGIKVFNGNGLKISEEQEIKIENIFFNIDEKTLIKQRDWASSSMGMDARQLKAYNLSVQHYLADKIKNEIDRKFLIMIDCANGATSNHVEDIFNNSDIIDILPMHNNPDGTNINDKCGATDIDSLIKEVKSYNNINQRKVDLGVAFDGDGDRAIFVTENGDVVDGDEILYILSKFKKDYKNYEGPVVGTLMTNYGIQSAYKNLGIDFYATNVGDKFVYQKMTDINAEIGGESSGHITITDFIDIPVGDGIITLINLLEVLSQTEFSLDDFKKATSKIITPSKLINIPVRNKKEFMGNKINQKIFIDLENKVTDLGRILIRESGTENLIRLLIEHPDSKEIEKLEKYFCDNIQKT
ncbi:MAG: hypothetical protein ACJ0QT_02895 [Gammaproteobacteria bacterium]